MSQRVERHALNVMVVMTQHPDSYAMILTLRCRIYEGS
jgi:hypothetical protein